MTVNGKLYIETMRTILGPGGKVRARIRECGSREELLSPGGTLLGYYDSNSNMTYEPGGKFIGYGNQLFLLIEDWF